MIYIYVDKKEYVLNLEASASILPASDFTASSFKNRIDIMQNRKVRVSINILPVVIARNAGGPRSHSRLTEKTNHILRKNMPHFPNSPEASLNRNDSLDPSRTCKGTTAAGRACRRGLASRPTKTDQLSFYCWQHKDQTNSVSSSSSSPEAGTAPMPPGSRAQVDQRTSIDSMMQRLGLEDKSSGGHYEEPPGKRSRRRVRKTYCCCFEVWETEYGDMPPARLRPQLDTGRKRPLIPPTVSHNTTVQLRAELSKPLSDKDEPGYIYIFWLTPEEALPQSRRGRPPAELFFSSTSSLSDAIRSNQDIRAFVSKPTSTNPGTIRLKIGRASNVQRRLNEWTRQCSYNVTLIRFYPYTSSQNVPRKVPYVHRVEHLIHTELNDKRVRDMEKCPECGKQHKEWFEIKADKDELRRVDECIRRWVAWADRASTHMRS